MLSAIELKQKLWQIQDTGDSPVSWRIESKGNSGNGSDWRGRQRSDEGTKAHRVCFSNCKLHQRQPPENLVREAHNMFIVSTVIVLSYTTNYTSWPNKLIRESWESCCNFRGKPQKQMSRC